MKHYLLPKLRAGMFAVASIVAATLVCCKDNPDDFTIYYADIVDMGQTMSFTSGKPSYGGGTPSAFEIYSVTRDKQSVDFTESFLIDSQTGVVKITKTDDLATGIYRISVRCSSNGSKYSFQDVLKVELLPSGPSSIEITPREVYLEYGKETQQAIDSAVVAFTSSSCSALNYALEQEKGKEYFMISKRGVIKLNSAFKEEVPPGIYELSVKVLTAASTTIFTNAVRFCVVSKPLALTYTPAQGKMEENYIFESAAPVLKGSQTDLQYTIKSVSPQTNKIIINPTSGVISVAENSGLSVGATFKISVSASNTYGSNDFEDAYSLEVIGYISPISNFSYGATSEIQSTAWSISPVAGMAGDEVTFTFEDLPKELVNKVTLDSSTGQIGAVKGNTIPVGSYSIKVRATNVKNSLTSTLALTIEANPNYFTKIVYGNNLGLVPAENYANQFAFSSKAELEAYGDWQPTTDIKSGADVEWTLEPGYLGTIGSNIIIDPATGFVKVTYFGTANCIFFFVRATVGKGTPTEFSRRVPVFMNSKGIKDGITYSYKPFALKINPKIGGRSEAPNTLGLAQGKNVFATIRRSWRYINVDGPVSHHDPNKQGTQPGEGGLLMTLWNNYYAPSNANYGKEDPTTYYANTANPGKMLVYVDPVTNQIVVNPEKFKDDDGVYANGIFIAQLVYIVTEKSSIVYSTDLAGSANQILPFVIWFDTEF